jgi:hypothetical protein
MDLMARLSKDDIRELFSKNWLTHDAMWYGSCVQALGPEKANHLNKQAVRLMAGIEMGRILKLMGKPKAYTVTRFDALAEIMETAFRLVQTDFMQFNFGFPEENRLRGQFTDCFAYNGVRKFGMLEDYDCGIVERVKGWLDALGVAYTATAFSGCLMHTNGECRIDFRFDLNPALSGPAGGDEQCPNG